MAHVPEEDPIRAKFKTIISSPLRPVLRPVPPKAGPNVTIMDPGLEVTTHMNDEQLAKYLDDQRRKEISRRTKLMTNPRLSQRPIEDEKEFERRIDEADQIRRRNLALKQKGEYSRGLKISHPKPMMMGRVGTPASKKLEIKKSDEFESPSDKIEFEDLPFETTMIETDTTKITPDDDISLLEPVSRRLEFGSLMHELETPEETMLHEEKALEEKKEEKEEKEEKKVERDLTFEEKLAKSMEEVKRPDEEAAADDYADIKRFLETSSHGAVEFRKPKAPPPIPLTKPKTTLTELEKARIEAEKIAKRTAPRTESPKAPDFFGASASPAPAPSSPVLGPGPPPPPPPSGGPVPIPLLTPPPHVPTPPPVSAAAKKGLAALGPPTGRKGSPPPPTSPSKIKRKPPAKGSAADDLAKAMAMPGAFTIDPITGKPVAIPSGGPAPSGPSKSRATPPSGKRTGAARTIPITGSPALLPDTGNVNRLPPSLERRMREPEGPARFTRLDLAAKKEPITQDEEVDFEKQLNKQYRESKYGRIFHEALSRAPAQWAMVKGGLIAAKPYVVPDRTVELLIPPSFAEKWVSDGDFYRREKAKILADMRAPGNERLLNNIFTNTNPNLINDLASYDPNPVPGVPYETYVYDKLSQLSAFLTLYDSTGKQNRLQKVIGFDATQPSYRATAATQFTADELKRILDKEEMYAVLPSNMIKSFLDQPEIKSNADYTKSLKQMLGRFEQAQLARENGYMNAEDYLEATSAIVDDLGKFAQLPGIVKVTERINVNKRRDKVMLDWRIFNDRINLIDKIIERAPNNLISKKLQGLKNNIVRDLKATGDLEEAFDKMNGIRNILNNELEEFKRSGGRDFDTFMQNIEYAEQPIPVTEPEQTVFKLPPLPDKEELKDPKVVEDWMAKVRTHGIFAFPSLKLNKTRPVKVTERKRVRDPMSRTGYKLMNVDRIINKSTRNHFGVPIGTFGAYNVEDKKMRDNLHDVLTDTVMKPVEFENEKGVKSAIPIQVLLDGGKYVDINTGKEEMWKGLSKGPEGWKDLAVLPISELDTMRKGFFDAIEKGSSGILRFDLKTKIDPEWNWLNPRTPITKRVLTDPKRTEAVKEALARVLYKAMRQVQDAWNWVADTDAGYAAYTMSPPHPLSAGRQESLKALQMPTKDVRAKIPGRTTLKTGFAIKKSKAGKTPLKELRIDKEFPMGSAAREAALGEAAKKYSDNNFKFSRKISKEEPEINKAYYGDNILEFDIKNAADLQRMKAEVTRLKGKLYVVDLRTGRLFPIDFDKTFIGQNYVFVLENNTSGKGGKKLQHKPKYVEYNKKAAESVEKGGGFGDLVGRAYGKFKGYDSSEPPIRSYYGTLHSIMRDEHELFPHAFMRNGRDKGQQMLKEAVKIPYFNDYRDQMRNETGGGLWKAVRKGIVEAGKGAGNYTIRKTVAAGKELGKQTIYEGKHFVNNAKRDIGYIGRANQQLYRNPSFGNLNNAINKTVLGSVRLASRPVITAARETANASDFLSKVPGVNVAKQAVMFYAPPLAVANALVHGVKNVDEGRLTDAAINAGDALIGSGKLKGNIDLGARVLQAGVKIGDRLFDKTHNQSMDHR